MLGTRGNIKGRFQIIFSHKNLLNSRPNPQLACLSEATEVYFTENLVQHHIHRINVALLATNK